MTPSDSTAQKLPLWIFFLTDAALLAAAAYLAQHAPRPLSTQTIFIVAALVLAGALAALVPLVARYERQKNEALDDRQRALEALARTLTTSAEQISIATAGLNEIAELTRKNLKQAEQLPAALGEKVSELSNRLAGSEADTLDALEKQLAALRASESERLAASAEKIAQSAAQLGQLAATSHQHLTAARESLAQLGSASTQHFSELDTATTAAIAKAQAAAAESLASAHARATSALDGKLAAGLGAIDAKLAHLATQLGEQVDRAATTLDTKLAALTVAAASVVANVAVPAPTAAPETIPTETTPAPATETPRRPRKNRRDELPAELPPTEEPLASVAENVADTTEPAASVATTVEPPSAPETASLPTPAPELSPEAPAPADIVTSAPFFHSSPFLSPAPEAPTPPSDSSPVAWPVEPNLTAAAEPVVETPKPARKRSPKKAEIPAVAPEPIPALADAPITPLATTPEPSDALAESTPPAAAEETVPPAPAAPTVDDEFVQFSPDELPIAPVASSEFKLHSPDATVSSMTADGATRLLATAYIGIGNRLFIRGEGPGLSWEKGIPLQFVSIGKWRWETAETAAPIAFKLYKNDSVECTSLGEQSISPGHLTEVTATF